MKSPTALSASSKPLFSITDKETKILTSLSFHISHQSYSDYQNLRKIRPIMASTPPYHRSETRSRTKSASRIPKLRCYNAENEVSAPNLSLEIVPCSPIASPSPSKSPYALPIHELLHLSPSPLRRSRTRIAEKVEMADDGVESQELRKRFKNRNYGMGLLGHASPRNNRRSRRRTEQDVREEKEFGGGEEFVRPRKKRQSGRSKKDKLSSVPSTPSPKATEGERCNLDGIKQFINDLVMWKDVAKSSLWFGIGSICFLSSCCTSGIKFSILSIVSQLGLLFLIISFFSNSIRRRDGGAVRKSEFKLKEEDILKVGKLILPAANLAISKAKELFSGEPGMTLKVVPFLLVGAQFGHLLTIRRLCGLGFFISFTCPKLYTSYSVQMHKKVEKMNLRVFELWGSCSHKKIVAASVLTAFWNLTTIRTRIFAAFISLVLVRYNRQNSEARVDEERVEDEQEHQKAIVVVKSEALK